MYKILEYIIRMDITVYMTVVWYKVRMFERQFLSQLHLFLKFESEIDGVEEDN